LENSFIFMPMKYNGAMSTQKEIARRCGVDASLVSMALRNHPNVAQKTKERILAMAREIGYRPNAALSEAAGRRWKHSGGQRRETVAFIRTRRRDVAEISLIEQSASARLDELGYGMGVLAADDFPSEQALSHTLYARGIRGVLIEQSTFNDRTRALDWKRFAVVQCGLLKKTPGVHQVCLDFSGVVNETLERLGSAGYRRVAFLFSAEKTLYHSDALLLQAAHGAKAAGLFPDLSIKVFQDSKKLASFSPQAVLVTEPWTEDELACRPVQVGLLGDHACEGLPGFAFQLPLLGRMGAELLDSRLRAHDFGIPAIAQRLVFVPPWKTDPPLPVLNESQPLTSIRNACTGTKQDRKKPSATP